MAVKAQDLSEDERDGHRSFARNPRSCDTVTMVAQLSDGSGMLVVIRTHIHLNPQPVHSNQGCYGQNSIHSDGNKTQQHFRDSIWHEQP